MDEISAFRHFCHLLVDSAPKTFDPRVAHVSHPGVFTEQMVHSFIANFSSLYARAFPGRHFDACAVCGIEARFRCSACHEYHYCSESCQREHWKTHRKECRKRTKTVVLSASRGGKAIECVIPASAGMCSACSKDFSIGERSYDFEFVGGVLGLSFCSEECLCKGRTELRCIRDFRVSLFCVG